MSIPAAPPSFWPALVDDIRAKGIQTVQAQCMGGHGRTGTALAIFLGRMRPGEFATTDALVDELRSIYCANAVETERQLDYIAEATGLPYRGETGPSKQYPASGYGWSGGTYTYHPQQTLFQPDAEESYPALGELGDEGRIAATSSADLLILAGAHATDLGCALEHVSENGFDFYVLIDEQTGEVEEFDTIEAVADYLQLDGIYHY